MDKAAFTLFENTDNRPKFPYGEGTIGPWKILFSNGRRFLFLGIIFSFTSVMGNSLITFGILLFGLSVLFTLITLPVEFNASRRAVKCLESSRILYDDELEGTKKVLSAAAMTYVASAAVALANFIRLIVIFGGRRRD